MQAAHAQLAYTPLFCSGSPCQSPLRSLAVGGSLLHPATRQQEATFPSPHLQPAAHQLSEVRPHKNSLYSKRSARGPASSHTCFQSHLLPASACSSVSEMARSSSNVLKAHIEHLRQREHHLALHPYPPPPPLRSSSPLLHNQVEYLRQQELHLARHPFPPPPGPNARAMQRSVCVKITKVKMSNKQA